MQQTFSTRPITWWLTIVATMVFLMVFIGGVTRLTDSGLSMTDWKPIMGTIPPLNQEQWQSAFDQYKQFPEYKLVNSQMDLYGFKKIYFWEWFHRLFGRLIGLAFFVPFIFFLVKKKLSQKQIKKFSLAFILGGLQGLMGWFMVKSGLVNNPDVSHYRLAAHLSLAFLIISYIYWLLLELKFTKRRFKSFRLAIPFAVFTFFLILQIVYGALVAGLDAGLTHNTFPKMGRYWVPNDLFILAPTYLNLLENPVSLQFVHRYLGYVVFLLGGGLWLFKRKHVSFQLRKSINVLMLLLVIQVCLGALTLVLYVPIWSASLHQLGACLLLLTSVRCLFFSTSAQLEMA